MKKKNFHRLAIEGFFSFCIFPQVRNIPESFVLLCFVLFFFCLFVFCGVMIKKSYLLI